MGIPMAYNTGTTNTYTEKTVKRGTIALNPGPLLAPSYNWFNGVDATATQYLIYSDTYTTGQATQANSRPTAWTTPDLSDTSLLALINTLPERVGQTPFTYAPVALKWLHQSGRYFLLKNNFENIVTNGLILNLDGSWPNSYSGTSTWFDLSGQGNNGTLTNGPTLNTSNGGSIQFDGANDYIGLPNGLLSGTGNFTINQWIKCDSSELGGTTFGNYPSGDLQMFFGYNYIGLWLSNNSTYLGTSPWNSVLPEFTTNPVMITAVRSGSTTYFYINGVLQKTGSSSATIGSSSALFRIGTNTSNSEQYTGNIGVTQVYNRALSPAEIMQNFYAQGYRFGYSADTIVTSGLTLSLDAANGLSYSASGSTWYDIKESGGNNGTLTNGAVFSATTGGVIIFDGTDDIINFPSSYNATTAGLNNYHSVEMWVYPYVVTRGDDGLFKSLNGGGGTGRHLHYIIRNSRFHLGWYSIDTTGNQILTNNTWYQVVFMFDTDDRQKIYVNGALDAAGVVLSNNPNLIDGKFYNGGTGPIWLGWYSSYFQGLMPIVRVYNRALSASEVLQNYNAQKGRFGL